MANYKLLLNHISKWEGKMGADPRDGCAVNPSDFIMPTGPFKGYKVHTVRGICFTTWQANARKLGFDPSSKGFANMTHAQWEMIVKKIFWDGRNLDYINSQKIAELIFESTWGSGFGGSSSLIKFMQNKIGVTPDGEIGTNTIKALNNYTRNKDNENSLYKSMFEFRVNYYKNLAKENPVKYGSFINGWLNRMNALWERSNLVQTTSLSLGFLIALGYAFYLYKKNII